MAQPRRRWWIPVGLAAGLSAAALALALRQIARPPGPNPGASPPTPAEPIPTAAPAAPTSRPRSATELRDALLQGGALPQNDVSPGTAKPEASPGRSVDGRSPEARPPAGGSPVAWSSLHERCLDSVRRSQPLDTLRLTGSTGFIPSSPAAAARLGKDWDQAIRLDLERAAGGGGALRFECYYLNGALVTTSAS
jgi:hypothetical protein